MKDDGYFIDTSGCVYPKFETVDELFTHIMYMNHNVPTRGGESLESAVIEYIISFHSQLLLFSLNQKTNIPSKYDLHFINIISRDKLYYGYFKDILDVYKKREESQC